MPSGKQALVGLGGVGLIAANYIHGSNRSALSGLIFAGTNISQAHTALVELGSELLAVVVATVVAGLSDQAAEVMIVILVILWILWLINFESKKKG